MKNSKMILVLLLILISGTGCKTLELVHDDVRCEGVPRLTVEFTTEEKLATPSSVLDKFFIRSGELQNRIKKNCKDVKAHNKDYEK